VRDCCGAVDTGVGRERVDQVVRSKLISVTHQV
jgi:hypothetical protein